MLRLFAIFLLLANVSYYVWSDGWLRSWGLAPTQESEPQHAAQQISPEALRILPRPDAAPEAAAADPDTPPARPVPPEPAPAAAAPLSAAPPAPVQAVVLQRTVTLPPVAASSGECLQAGPFDPAQAQVWRQAASALPQGSWRLESSPVPGRWMIYMGRFADADVLAKKRVELRIRKVSFDRINNPELEPGLALGRFSSEEAAQRGLVNLSNRGVRTARVLLERPASETFTLRLPLVDAALQARLSRLHSALAGNPLRSCFSPK
ncbi:hypothetical protein [Simplicispira psychrophila]|uniref:hypothetical protein n=1 Tax=Simplicispira psychrophila TaxID=80882 RepID=UPI000480A41A|nr:hypothetical protein [Simplicispira psychrophila]